MKKNSNGKYIIFYIIFFVVIIILANSLMTEQSTETEITYGEVVAKFQNEEIKRCYVDNESTLYLSTSADEKDGFQFIHRLADKYIFTTDLHELIEKQISKGILTFYDIEPPAVIPWWLAYMPYLIIIIALVVIWWLFLSRTAKNGGMGGLGGRMNSFSKARTKLGSEEKKKVLFSDVAGADEEKEELQEVVEFLKNPDKYSELGAKIPKGVLLVGAPGTGKTLLAKAVAGESGVPFYSISGSDFVEMYVGVGASRVRDLFETAKKTAPCIIFIDEIDAVGRHRGAGLGGGHDEREQTLNQLLVEMDGFGVNDGVIVIAATNRPDILDPALLRPGRFDRQVTVNYPDIKGREAILKVHSRGKPLGGDVNLSTLAKSTSGFTGADLANLLNEAALLAARKKKSVINMDDIEEATIKVIVGPQKKSLVITEEEKRNTAYHEAGHAIVTRFLKTQDPVHQISIIPSGRALGYTLSLPEKDKMNVYKNELSDRICTLLGGRAAEKLMLTDISAGASNDMERATDIARKMVTQYGMSDVLGPIVYSSGHEEVFLGKDFGTTKNYSEEIAALIDQEIKSIIVAEYNKAVSILQEHADILHFISSYLVKHEIMDAEQFEMCFNEGVTVEMLEAVSERKKKAANVENAARFEEINDRKKLKAKRSGTEDVIRGNDKGSGDNDFSDDIIGH